LDNFANVPSDNVFSGHVALNTTTLKLIHPTKDDSERDERFPDNEICVSPVFLNTSSSIVVSAAGKTTDVNDDSPLNVPAKRVVNGHPPANVTEDKLMQFLNAVALRDLSLLDKLQDVNPVDSKTLSSIVSNASGRTTFTNSENPSNVPLNKIGSGHETSNITEDSFVQFTNADPLRKDSFADNSIVDKATQPPKASFSIVTIESGREIRDKLPQFKKVPLAIVATVQLTSKVTWLNNKQFEKLNSPKEVRLSGKETLTN
jgi:hypothetical protein